MENSKNVLAAKLKAYRKKYDLTQDEFAKKTGLTVRGYGKIERCEVTTTLGTLDKLAKAMDTTAAELLRQ